MYRRKQKPRFSNNLVASSSSDSEPISDSEASEDSDHSLELPTSSDVINSFLNRNKTVQQPNKVSKSRSRKASDVINSFLQKNKVVDRANSSQFESALDVINSYLRKDKFGSSGTPVTRTRRIESTDDSSSESDLDTRKRRREISVSSSTSDSDSPVDRNVVKKRRIEISPVAEVMTNDQIDRQADSIEQTSGLSSITIDLTSNDNPTVNQLEPQAAGENGESSQNDLTNEEIRQSSTATASGKDCNRRSSRNCSKAKPDSIPKKKKSVPQVLRMSFTRAVRGGGTKEVVEVIRGTKIPKEKYDRALGILNATVWRYDETPVDYGLPKPVFDVRQNCISRRHAEATYDHWKLGMSAPVSLTRIVVELDNCLKRENWQEMAELIYFGCDLMKTEQSRRAIGTTFFTYALLLLLLDSSPSSLSTLDGKRNEIMKFLVALGSEPEENEEFLNELYLVTDSSDDLLVIKSEKD